MHWVVTGLDRKTWPGDAGYDKGDVFACDGLVLSPVVWATEVASMCPGVAMAPVTGIVEDFWTSCALAMLAKANFAIA